MHEPTFSQNHLAFGLTSSSPSSSSSRSALTSSLTSFTLIPVPTPPTASHQRPSLLRWRLFLSFTGRLSLDNNTPIPHPLSSTKSTTSNGLVLLGVVAVFFDGVFTTTSISTSPPRRPRLILLGDPIFTGVSLFRLLGVRSINIPSPFIVVLRIQPPHPPRRLSLPFTRHPHIPSPLLLVIQINLDTSTPHSQVGRRESESVNLKRLH